MIEKGVDFYQPSQTHKGDFNTNRFRTVQYNKPLDINRYQRKKGPKLFNYLKNRTSDKKIEDFNSLFNEEKDLKINTKYIENIKDFELKFQTKNTKKPKLNLESSKLDKFTEQYEKKGRNDVCLENHLHLNYLDTDFPIDQENDLLVIRKYMLNLYFLNKNKIKKSESSTNNKKPLVIFDEDDLYNNTEKCVNKICDFIDERLKMNQNTQKICFFKEIELNNSFKFILDNIFRNISFMKENNVEISKKLIRNLLISEIKEKNRNLSTFYETNFLEKKSKTLQTYHSNEGNENEKNKLNQSRELHMKTHSNFSGKKTFFMLKANKFQSKFQNFLGDNKYNGQLNSKSRNFLKNDKNDSQKNHTLSTNIVKNDTAYSHVMNTDNNIENDDKFPLIQNQNVTKSDKSNKIVDEVERIKKETFTKKKNFSINGNISSIASNSKAFASSTNKKNSKLKGYSNFSKSRITHRTKSEDENDNLNLASPENQKDQENFELHLNIKEEGKIANELKKTKTKNTLSLGKNLIRKKGKKSKKNNSKKQDKKSKSKLEETKISYKNNETNCNIEFFGNVESEELLKGILTQESYKDNTENIHSIKFNNLKDYDGSIEITKTKEAKSFTYGFKDISEESFTEDFNRKENITEKKLLKINEKKNSLKKLISIKPQKLKLENKTSQIQNENLVIDNQNNEESGLTAKNQNKNISTKSIELKNKYTYSKIATNTNSKIIASKQDVKKNIQEISPIKSILKQKQTDKKENNKNYSNIYDPNKSKVIEEQNQENKEVFLKLERRMSKIKKLTEIIRRDSIPKEVLVETIRKRNSIIFVENNPKFHSKAKSSKTMLQADVKPSDAERAELIKKLDINNQFDLLTSDGKTESSFIEKSIQRNINWTRFFDKDINQEDKEMSQKLKDFQVGSTQEIINIIESARREYDDNAYESKDIKQSEERINKFLSTFHEYVNKNKIIKRKIKTKEAKLQTYLHPLEN